MRNRTTNNYRSYRPYVLRDAEAVANGGVAPSLSVKIVGWMAESMYHPMAYGATGDGSADDRTVLNSLFNTTMSTGGWAFIDRSYKVGSNLTVPAGVSLHFNKGGEFVVPAGVTVTINGPVEALPIQIFDLTGTAEIRFGLGGQSEAYPEWFGADNTGVVSAVPAIQKAVKALQYGGTIRFLTGVYLMDTSVVVYGLIDDSIYTFVGQSYQTKLNIVVSVASTAFKVNIDETGAQVHAFPQHPMAIFRDLQVTAISSTAPVTFVRTARVGIQAINLFLDYCWQGIQTTSAYNDLLYVENVRWRFPVADAGVYGYGVYMTGFGDGLRIERCSFSGRGVFLGSCLGGTILSCIGGAYVFDQCTNISFIDNHTEVTSTYDFDAIITVRDCQQMVIDNNYIQNNSATIPSILVEERSGASNAERMIAIRNNTFAISQTGDAAYQTNTIEWISADDETNGRLVRGRMVLDDNFMYTWNGLSLAYEMTGIKVRSSNSALNTLLTTYRNYMSFHAELTHDLIAGWMFYGRLPDGREVNSNDTVPRSFRIFATPNIGTVTALATYDGSILSGTTYYYKVALYDGGHNTIASSEKTATTTIDNQTILLQFTALPLGCTLRVWRGTVSGTYTHYVDIDTVQLNRLNLYDQGANILGYTWQTSPPAVPTTSTSRTVYATDGVLQHFTVDITDDSVYSFTPIAASGVLLLHSRQSGQSNVAALIHFRALSSPFCTIIAQPGTTMETSTATLTGTTGTDVKVTVSATSGGLVYIENRFGSTIQVGYDILARY